MAVRLIHQGATRQLLIDIAYLTPDGKRARYRRQSNAATKAAAEVEERAIQDRIAKTGTPFEASAAPSEEPKRIAPRFCDVVEIYRIRFMETELKASSRSGYERVLSYHLLPHFGDLPMDRIDEQELRKFNDHLAGERLANGKRRKRATRNNVHIVLRSVLGFAVDRGLLGSMPSGLPPLKRVPQTVLSIPTDEQVRLILGAAMNTQRRFFSLMAYAGLRTNEVRVLRGRDLRWCRDGEALRGYIDVRHGMSDRVEDTPKTGTRTVPVMGPLQAELARKTSPDTYVALTAAEAPWGVFGPGDAFERVCRRLGITGFSIYSLRHFAITSWLRAGVPVHVVQRMAGHKNLSTTERYVHMVDGDLNLAADRCGSIWAATA